MSMPPRVQPVPVLPITVTASLLSSGAASASSSIVGNGQSVLGVQTNIIDHLRKDGLSLAEMKNMWAKNTMVPTKSMKYFYGGKMVADEVFLQNFRMRIVDEQAPTTKPSNERLRIQVCGENEKWSYLLKSEASFIKLREAHARRFGLAVESVMFYYKNIKIRDNYTPIGLKMRSGELIKVSISTKQPGFVDVTVSDQKFKTKHRVKYDVGLGTLQRKYEERFNVPANTKKFLFNEREIRENDTPRSLKMKDNDVIVVRS